MRQISKCFPILLFLLGIHFAIAETPWFELYDSALNDMRSKNWSLAEEKLKAAMAQQPNQGKKVRAYGARFMKYIPEYQLAVIHYNTGNYQQALEELLRVRNKGLVSEGDDEYADLSRMQQQIITKLTPQAPNLDEKFADLMRDAEQALQQNNFDKAKQLTKDAMGTGVDQKKASDLMMKIHVAETADDLKTALNQNDLGKAKQIAEELKMLDANNPELARAQQLFAQNKELPKPPVVETKTPTQQPPGPSVNPPSTAQVTQPGEVPASFTALQKQQVAANLERLQVLMRGKDWQEASRVAEETLRLDPSNRRAAGIALQAKEEVAVLSFYEGEYRSAADILETLTLKERKSARNHFYLGCSFAALAFMEDLERPRLLKKAREEFAEARKLDPRLQFDRRYISPRILNVYEQ